MAVSKLLPSGGANDFNLNITGATTTVTFDKEYAGGSYSITSSAVDLTLDFYAYSAAGTLVGYTGTKAFTASSGFNKIVVLGGTVGDVIGFTFKKTFTTSAATAEVTAGPVITSVSPSAAPNINDTVTITGANFASNVTVTFTGTGYTATAAKNIVRSSSTSLIVTRPDSFPTTGSPYTITVSNPGVSDPVGSSVNILTNSVTAGTNPVWATGTPLPVYTKNVAYTQTFVASDTEASDVDYSIVSGALPTGIILNGETGVISGTPTVTTDATFTVRATDDGGNFLDKAFSLPNINPNGPIWVTAAGALTAGVNATAYTTTVTATATGGVSYSLVSGALPTGTSLNTSTGVISGTPTGGSYSFTLRATDANVLTSDRAFSIAIESSYQIALVGGGSIPYSQTSRTGHGGLGVFIASGLTGKTITYTIGATGGTSDSHGGSRAKGNGGGSGGGTWIKFNGTVVAAVGGGGAQAYTSDYGAHGGGLNGNGGTGQDSYGSPLGQGATTSAGGAGGASNSGSFLMGGSRSGDQWGAPGGGGYYGGGGGAADQQGQGGTPGGGGSGYLSIPAGLGVYVSTVYNSGNGVGANSESGDTVPNAGTYFSNGSQGGANNTGGLRIWKNGTLILDVTTPQTDTSYTIA
jgi:hypothetical protein